MSNSIFRKVALERLSSPEELDQLGSITRPGSWVALAALGALLLVAVLWSVVARLPLRVEGHGLILSDQTNGAQLAAVVYLPIDDGAKVRPGMAVSLALPGAPQTEFGRLLGNVRDVADLPADRQALLKVVGNDAVVQSLVSSGELIKVRVALSQSTGGSPSYRWTSPRGQQASLHPGMPCSGAVTIDEQAPFRFVIP